MRNVRLKRTRDEKKIDIRRWRDNPFVGTRELDGLSHTKSKGNLRSYNRSKFMLGQLSRQQIRDAFRAGGYEGEEPAGFTSDFEERIAELKKL
jgi:hypothetical protein